MTRIVFPSEPGTSAVPAILAAADEISGQATECERLQEENAELQIRNDELWTRVCDQSVQLNALRAQLDRARAVEDWHGQTSGGRA